MTSLLRVHVKYLPVGVLRPRPTNARRHSTKQLHQIANSIREFGFTSPVLIDSTNVIIAGHGRVEGAKLAGLSQVPTICVDHLTPQQVRAYVIADNRVAEKASWDPEILKSEFRYLAAEQPEFDLEITGFDSAEIDIMLDGEINATSTDPADLIPSIEKNAVSCPGDVWLLGEHRLACGDARDEDTCSKLFGTERARVMFADPPYNVPIRGHVGGRGATKHREFLMGAGEMAPVTFTRFLKAVLSNAAVMSVDGAIHYLCMDWRHITELLAAADGLYTELKNLCIWNKNNGGMGSFYRSKHELIFVYKVGTAPHINNIELGRSGRYRTNVWDYPGVNTFRTGRGQELSMHPTVKPVSLVADAIRDCTRRRDVVFDPFAGSGTSLIAAEKSGRRACAIEIDPLYVDVAIKRWESFSGRRAIHLLSGHSFCEVQDERPSPRPNATRRSK
jgi:DNA modification methylase